MKGRISVFIALGVLVAGFALMKVLENSKDEESKEKLVPPPKLVRVNKVTYDTMISKISSFGYLSSKDKIQIFTEVSGVMQETTPPFKEGSRFSKGQVLFKLDDTEAKLNLVSMKSDLLNALILALADIKNDFPEAFPNWKSYTDGFDIKSPLKELPEVNNTQLKYYLSTKNIYKVFYNIKRMEVQLSKYSLTAPFDGVLTSVNAEPGSLVRAMQAVGEFKGNNIYELELALNQEDERFIEIGNKVQVFSNDQQGSWIGKIIRINPNIDASSQTINVYVSLSGSNLKDGMYMNAEILGNDIPDVVKVPRNALVDDNSVYVVVDSMLKLKKAEIVRKSEKFAYLRGVEEGSQMVIEPLINASSDLKVKPVIEK